MNERGCTVVVAPREVEREEAEGARDWASWCFARRAEEEREEEDDEGPLRRSSGVGVARRVDE